MFVFLLVLHAIIAALLVAVILMQKSEGGGLGMGGSPSGLMSARGAADFLTRATATLASLFVAFSIVLAIMAANHRPGTIDTSLARKAAPLTPAQDSVPAPADSQPFATAAQNAAAAAANSPASVEPPATRNGAVPLQH